MTDVRVLVVGAHPDDAEIKAGGLAAHHADRGNEVRFVSLTDGSAGHHELGRDATAARRADEADSAAAVLDVEARVLGTPDGELRPTLERRKAVVRLVREFDPSLLLTHRRNDYHPDHRYAAQLVADAVSMLRVPNVCPEVEPVGEPPVVCHLSDRFEKPRPFEADVVVPIDDVIERKLDALHEHTSQVYEWLPHVEDALGTVPDGEAARREWLAETWVPRFRAVADRHRAALVDRYGEAGHEVEHAEAFEVCQYGATPRNLERLFP